MITALIIAGVVLILLAGCFCCLFCMGATRVRRAREAGRIDNMTNNADGREARGDYGAAYAYGHSRATATADVDSHTIRFSADQHMRDTADRNRARRNER